jgi:pilus assembly protein Flp/PilA
MVSVYPDQSSLFVNCAAAIFNLLLNERAKWGHLMFKVLRKLTADSRGATAVEYGLIISLIVVAMVVSLNGVGTKTGSMWNNIATTVLAH